MTEREGYAWFSDDVTRAGPEPKRGPTSTTLAEQGRRQTGNAMDFRRDARQRRRQLREERVACVGERGEDELAIAPEGVRRGDRLRLGETSVGQLVERRPPTRR